MQTTSFGPKNILFDSRSAERSSYYDDLQSQVEGFDAPETGSEDVDQMEIEHQEWEQVKDRLDYIDDQKIQATELTEERLNRLHEAMAANNIDAFVEEFEGEQNNSSPSSSPDNGSSGYEELPEIDLANVQKSELPTELAKKVQSGNQRYALMKWIGDFLGLAKWFPAYFGYTDAESIKQIDGSVAALTRSPAIKQILNINHIPKTELNRMVGDSNLDFANKKNAEAAFQGIGNQGDKRLRPYFAVYLGIQKIGENGGIQGNPGEALKTILDFSVNKELLSKVGKRVHAPSTQSEEQETQIESNELPPEMISHLSSVTSMATQPDMANYLLSGEVTSANNHYPEMVEGTRQLMHENADKLIAKGWVSQEDIEHLRYGDNAAPDRASTREVVMMAQEILLKSGHPVTEGSELQRQMVASSAEQMIAQDEDIPEEDRQSVIQSIQEMANDALDATPSLAAVSALVQKGKNKLREDHFHEKTNAFMGINADRLSRFTNEQLMGLSLEDVEKYGLILQNIETQVPKAEIQTIEESLTSSPNSQNLSKVCKELLTAYAQKLSDKVGGELTIGTPDPITLQAAMEKIGKIDEAVHNYLQDELPKKLKEETAKQIEKEKEMLIAGLDEFIYSDDAHNKEAIKYRLKAGFTKTIDALEPPTFSGIDQIDTETEQYKSKLVNIRQFRKTFLYRATILQNRDSGGYADGNDWEEISNEETNHLLNLAKLDDEKTYFDTAEHIKTHRIGIDQKSDATEEKSESFVSNEEFAKEIRRIINHRLNYGAGTRYGAFDETADLIVEQLLDDEETTQDSGYRHFVLTEVEAFAVQIAQMYPENKGLKNSLMSSQVFTTREQWEQGTFATMKNEPTFNANTTAQNSRPDTNAGGNPPPNNVTRDAADGRGNHVPGVTDLPI